jgi:membrane protein YqaA with SNARE-associated domain
VGRSLLWIVGLYALFILIVFLIGKYLVDFNSFFKSILDSLSDNFVLILFIASESFLGMIPVDLFVVWTQKFESPLTYLALLGILSYAGSIISYGIGRWISGRPKINAYSERNLRQYMEFSRKWGGAFIIIAALFPFTPFSLVVIALSLLKYPFRLFLIFALTRLVRFIIQGILMFYVLQIQNWIT